MFFYINCSMLNLLNNVNIILNLLNNVKPPFKVATKSFHILAPALLGDFWEPFLFRSHENCQSWGGR